MRLTGQSCGNLVAAGDINIQQELAKCARCGKVFPLTSSIDTPPSWKRPIAPPVGFRCWKEGKYLYITRA